MPWRRGTTRSVGGTSVPTGVTDSAWIRPFVGGTSVPTGFTGAAWIRPHRESTQAARASAVVGAPSAAPGFPDSAGTTLFVGGTSVPTGVTDAAWIRLHRQPARAARSPLVVGAASAATGSTDKAWTIALVGGTSVPTGFSGDAGKRRQKLSPDGESLFFACAKKSNQKKPLYSSRMADQAHPAFAPATRVRSADGIFGRGILPRPKTAHILVRRPPAGGFTRQLRRCGGDPRKATAEEQQQQQQQQQNQHQQYEVPSWIDTVDARGSTAPRVTSCIQHPSHRFGIPAAAEGHQSSWSLQ